MVCIYREGRDIFSISVNYKHSLPVQQSCYRFLLAHFAEHLVVVAACKRLRDENDKIQGIEKYVSGLTNVEYTSFQLIASNQYLCCVKDFVNSICDHDLQYLSTEDFDEQKKYVLREYEYAGDSYQGSCNRFFYIMNGFEEIDVEKTLNNISFEELQNFIYENFSPSKCKVVYIGKHVNELQNVSLISNKIALNEPYKENFSSISSSLMKVFPSNKTEAWFGYRIPCISGMSDYIAHELVAKVIQIILHLSNKDEIENLKIINVGTHYTGRCPYSLYCVNTTFEKLKFEYTIDQIRLLVQAVTQEYRTRFYIKMDSLVELSKFIKKFYMLTGEIQYKLTDDIFHAFFTDNVCRLVDSICKKREFVVMQYYINEK